MSKLSNCTCESTKGSLNMASSFLTRVWAIRPDRELEGGGSSAIIVFSAMELMSLSCSSFEVRLSHKVSFSQKRLASLDRWTSKPRNIKFNILTNPIKCIIKYTIEQGWNRFNRISELSNYKSY